MKLLLVVLHEVSYQGKKELFIQCLKQEFLSWYETMTPVPWKKSCKWIAQDLFVGSGLILTDSKSNVDPPDVDSTCKLQCDDLSTHESLETEFRLTLEGEPGFGKTTLTSQVAYDWSQSNFSYSELLIFLPIKFVGELTLTDTLKECYIPDHKPLTEKYLYEILERGNSETCIILDGPDEYNPKVTEEEGKLYEVYKVMSKNKYSTCKVIITARSDYAQDLPALTMLRVGRFGETERNSLIEILFRSDEEKQKQMDRAINASSFILEISSVPLFFERVIHNFESIDKYKDEKQDKVTRFMMSIVDTLSKQICGNEKSGNTRNSKHRSAVEELALTGPCRGSQNLSWQRDDFEEIIDNVKEWINAVIIIIKDDISVKVNGELEPEDRLVPSASVTAKVKFLHKLFQEWYAAWYLSEIWSSKKESFSDVLNSLDAIDLHYILRFTCYLCPPYCHPILCHLMKKHRSTEGQKEPIMGCICLCFAECNETKGHDIKLIVRDICKEAIVIQSQDRRLLQYAKTVVPKFASQSQVSSVSKEEEDGKIQVEDQTQRLFDKPSGCTLKNVFWFPCTEKLVRRTLSIRETVKDALITAFKNNFTDHGVHIVPHYLGIRRSIKLRQKGIARKTLDFPVCDKQIEDNQYLSENQKLEILRKRIADRTVYDAAVAISKWAGDLELDMFIFTNYKYSDYLKNVAIATDIDGKHDIVVISRDLGVIFIQVSSSMGKSRKVAKQQLQKKTQQLMKDKLVFLESNRDLSEVTSKIPLYQLAAFPNFRREFVLLDVCRGHSQSFLTKECFYSDNIFVTLNEKISIPSEPCLSEKDYQYLCSRYVGIASTDNTRTALDGIKTTFKILKKAFLTSEQRQILDMDDINSCIVLTGDCGTGKSLMLTQKALRFAKNENCKPILVSCADLQRFGGLQTTFGNDTRGHLSIQKEILDKLDPNIATFSIKYAEDQSAIQQSFIEMFVSMLRGFTQGMEKVHILLDELPFITVKENPSIFNSLLESIPAECHLWLSTTTVSSTEEELLENLVSKQNCGPRRFKLFHLDKIMRMPEIVVNLYSSIQEFIGGQSSNKAIGHVVMGPKPMLFSLDVCSCKELDEASLTCLCTKLRLIKALRNIMKVVGDIEHDRISFYIHSITRLQEMFELLSDVMKTLNFSLKWWFEKESNDTESFSVLTENAHWRCESAIVISVDPLGMNHWEDGVGDRAIHTSVFSRCLSQYIHLVWPKQEAAELFNVELNSLEEDLRLYYVNARIMKENAHCRNAKSEEGCLEYLKKADLFVAGPQ
ncbi:hypothetical protein HOLleu_11459 [Holothuria leucospilota]|uniref:NACHT domain-containing protein n=1 Tax=Holothuria leucospilota TaxID=206669 RepID=A0A9Q1CF90_HOLLE|nr:hypothetical protein HOLleu_11459 [Holothuria leucospilota]